MTGCTHPGGCGTLGHRVGTAVMLKPSQDSSWGAPVTWVPVTHLGGCCDLLGMVGTGMGPTTC